MSRPFGANEGPPLVPGLRGALSHLGRGSGLGHEEAAPQQEAGSVLLGCDKGAPWSLSTFLLVMQSVLVSCGRCNTLGGLKQHKCIL